ncbi:MAG: thiamine pyrophosphate-binding protein [Rhodobacteraceae bacterium]|nr:thiamine pyrophosphate-binding protein [Paracoccaceae bacterium]
MPVTSPRRPLGAQISHMLRARGIDVIFGIPGVHNQEMYRGIHEAGITHVLARHEQGAGFMADGYARATGKPGVAYVITGPGLCNAMTPMGQAYSDSVPLLVLSSCLDETAARKGQLHQMRDQRAAAATVCDWSEEARSADAAYALVDRALAEFETGRPRPKHIQVPIALLQADAPPAPAPAPPALPGVPAAAVLARAEALLQGAQRPVVILGGGARGCAGLKELVRRTGALAMTTYAGRGAIDGDDPRCLGAVLARPGSAAVMEQADLVLAIGTELAEVDLWRDALGHRCPMVRVDVDASVLSDLAAGDLAVHSDAPGFVAALLARVEAWAGEKPFLWDEGRMAAQAAAFRAEVDAERPGIVPICDALRACLPRDTMIYSDMTQFAYVAKEVWPMDRPGHWHHPFGFGTLGYATPAAIGGAIARRGRPTLAIIGDYGFHYTLPEIGVAVELNLSLPILLWDNGKLKEIEDSMVRGQIAPNAVEARNPDFGALARAFGARAVAPANLAEMQRAVVDAFSAPGPTLVHLTPALSRGTGPGQDAAGDPGVSPSS